MELILTPNKTRQLGSLQTATSDKWINLTLGQFPSSIKSNIEKFLNPISGGTLTDDMVIILAAFDKQTRLYSQTYVPCVYANEDGLPCIAFNRTLYPLTLELLEKFEASVALQEMERYDELCIVLSYMDDDFIEFPFPLKLNSDNFKITLGEVKALFKKVLNGKAELSELGQILKVKTYGENAEGDFEKPLTLKELSTDVPYYVLRSEKVDFGSHINYVLTATENEKFEEGVEFRMYSPSKLTQSLDGGAKLSLTGEPSTNTYVIVKKGVDRKGEERLDPLIDNLDWSDVETVSF